VTREWDIWEGGIWIVSRVWFLGPLKYVKVFLRAGRKNRVECKIKELQSRPKRDMKCHNSTNGRDKLNICIEFKVGWKSGGYALGPTRAVSESKTRAEFHPGKMVP
jgi:hypothetical protein